METTPPTTAIYIAENSSEERIDSLKTALKRAVNWWGETWLREHDFPAVVSTIVNEMESGDSAGVVEFEEQGIEEPLHQLFVYHDHAGSDWGLQQLIEDLNGDVDSVNRVITESPDALVDNEHGVGRIEQLVVGAQVDVSFTTQRFVLQRGAHVDGARKRIVTTLSDSLHPRSDDGEGYEHTGGRPPLGYKAENGRLVPDDDFERVCTILQQVRDSKTSKREAASMLGCVRATIGNALDRPSMYNLR